MLVIFLATMLALLVYSIVSTSSAIMEEGSALGRWFL